MKLKIEEAEKSALVTRLERNQRDLNQLKTKLNSYVCEPRTYSLFERMETLRNGLDSLSNSNNEIIESLKSKRKTVDGYVDSAKEQLLKFNQLRKGIEEYVAGARSC